MPTGCDLRRLALALDGTAERPHFDRTAFRVSRIYATLAADGLTANLALEPADQEFRCRLAPDAFAPLPNAWGRQGWTRVNLGLLEEGELARALEAAWTRALPKAKRARPR